MDLDADPVQLPLDRRAVEAPDRFRHALGGGGEHRKDRPEELEADRREALPRLRPSRARPCASDRPRASARGGRDRPETPAAFTIASTISPASAPCRSSPVRRRLTNSASCSRCAAEQLDEDLLPLARRAASPRRLDLGDGAIEVVDRERRLFAQARTRRRRPSRSRRRSVPGGERRREARPRSEPRPARALRRSSARIATFPERELVAATSCEAATSSASSVISPRIVPVTGMGRQAGAAFWLCRGLPPSCDHSLDSVPRRA